MCCSHPAAQLSDALYMETGFQKQNISLGCVVSLNTLHPLSLCLTLRACGCSPRCSNRSMFSQGSSAALYLQAGCVRQLLFIPVLSPAGSWGVAEGKAAPWQPPVLHLPFVAGSWSGLLLSHLDTSSNCAFSPRSHYAAQNESKAAAKRV